MPTFGKQQELDLTPFIDNTLIFGNPQSGRIKKIKMGFNWLCFLFDWIALFAKGLIGNGLMIFGLNVAAAILITLANNSFYSYSHSGGKQNAVVFSIVILLAWVAIKSFVGSTGNKWHAESLANKGWILLNSHNEAAEKALNDYQWNLPRSTEEQVEEFITALSMNSERSIVENYVAPKILPKSLGQHNALRGGGAEANEPDPLYYAQAEQEIIDGTFDKGLWSKALVNAEGREELRKVEYMQLRAKQLKKLNEELIQYWKAQEKKEKNENLLTNERKTQNTYQSMSCNKCGIELNALATVCPKCKTTFAR